MGPHGLLCSIGAVVEGLNSAWGSAQGLPQLAEQLGWRQKEGACPVLDIPPAPCLPLERQHNSMDRADQLKAHRAMASSASWPPP